MNQMLSPEISSLDLSPIYSKIMADRINFDGEEINLETAGSDYKRFLTLHKKHPKKTLVPSVIIDTLWHYHMLDSRKYMKDCEEIFGEYLHHDPHFGLGSDEAKQENQLAWEETKLLWEQEFGEPLLGEANRCASTDCR